MEPARLTVLAGPTAVGKGTVAAEILANYPQIWLSISATTRPARPGEINGVHYWFVSQPEFLRMRDDGELLEWAQVHGKNYYGTPRQPVLDHLQQGIPTLLEIDLAGARQVKQTWPDALFVFLAPPSFSELERRLIGRGTEGEAERERRLATAKVELAAASEFDAIVVNETVTQAAGEIAALMGVSPTASQSS